MDEKNKKEEEKELKEERKAAIKDDKKKSKYGKLSGSQIGGICVGGVGLVVFALGICLHWPMVSIVAGAIAMGLGIIMLFIRK